MASDGSKVEKEEMISVALQLQKSFLADPQKPATAFGGSGRMGISEE